MRQVQSFCCTLISVAAALLYSDSFTAASEEEEGRNGSNSNHFAIENQLNRSLNGEEIDFVAHFQGIYFNYGYTILSLGEAYVVVFIIDASLVVVAFLSCIFSCHCYETIGTI